MKTAVQLLLPFLLNAAWQVLLIAGFAGCAGVLLRKAAARYQHALWVAALVLAIGLPLWSCADQFKALFVSPPAAPPPAGVILTGRLEVIEVDPGSYPATRIEPVSHSRSALRVNSTVALALAGLYLLFILYRMLNLFRAWLRTRTIIRSSYEVEFPESAQAIMRRCQTVIGVKRVTILCSPLVDVPITTGILDPLIILPEQLRNETDADVLSSALGHELVHIARRDYFLNLIYEFIYLPLSFHPAAAFVRRRIKASRELCCDERVTESLVNRDVYARSLVRLIAAAPPAGRLAANTTIGITESDNLEVRIMSLLSRPSLTARRKTLLLIAASLLLITPCVAAARLALNFDIGKQDAAISSASEREEKLERRQQEKEDLTRTLSELQEKAKQAPVSQRTEIEARMREVQRNLEEHEKLLREYELTKQPNEQRMQEAQRSLTQLEILLTAAQKSRPVNEARMTELRQKLARLEATYPLEQARMQEAREKLAQLDKQSGDRKVRVIYRVEPEYTNDAREKKIEGTVVLNMTIDHDGLPQNIQVKKSLYPSLDQSAIEAARKMRFEPAMKNGQPASQTISVEYVFSVESRSKQDIEEVQRRQAEEPLEMKKRRAFELEEVKKRQAEEPLEMKKRKAFEERSQEERALKQAELTRGATISMDRAVQIATSKFPGKVLACSLGRDREGDGRVFYHLVIINGDGDKSSTTYVWLSAVDGQILKSEKE